MKKRLLTILLAIAMVFTTTPVMALPAFADTDGDQAVMEEMDAVEEGAEDTGETDEAVTEESPTDTGGASEETQQEEEPIAAPAEDEETPLAAPAEDPVDNPVVKIGDKGYATLPEALEAAQAGDTITLAADIEVASYLEITKSMTIDLAGHTLSRNGNALLNPVGDGVALTVKDSAGGGEVASGTPVWVEGGASFVLENGTIRSTTEKDGSAIYVDGASVTINGGTVTSSYQGIYTIGILGKEGNSSLTVNGGTIEAKGVDSCAIGDNGNNKNTDITINGGTITAAHDIAIYKPAPGTLTVNGGTITGGTGIFQKSGKLVIPEDSTAKITGTGEKKDYAHSGDGALSTGEAIVVENCNYPGGAPEATIAGGTIVSEHAAAVASVAFDDPASEEAEKPLEGFIAGGTYSDNSAEKYLEKGLTVEENSDGTYSVTKTDLDDVVKIKAIADQTFTGFAIEPEIELEVRKNVTFDISQLDKDTDYSVTYTNNTNAGTATVTVKGVGNYTGQISKTFTINPADIANVKSLTIPAAQKMFAVENGGPFEPAINENAYIGASSTKGYKLVAGTDYDVTYSDNTGVGTGKATVTPKGNFTGDPVVLEFSIIEGVASITKDGTTSYYTTVTKAFDAAESGDTVVLLQDVTSSAKGSATVQLTAAKTVTLDLNGHSIKHTNGKNALYVVGKSGKIPNLTITGNGTIESNAAAIRAGANGVVTIGSDVTVIGGTYGVDVNGGNTTLNTTGRISGTTAGIFVAGAGTTYANKIVNVKGGTVSGGDYGVYSNQAATVNIHDGTVTGTTAAVALNGYQAYSANSNYTIKLNVTGGEIKGTGEAAAIAASGNENKGNYEITISGGTISSDDVAIYHCNDGVLTVTDGTITGATAIYQKSGTMNISGGTITGAGAKADYEFNGNGANATGDAVVVDNCGYPGGAPEASITGGIFESKNANTVASYAYGKDKDPLDKFVTGGVFVGKIIDPQTLPEGKTLVLNEEDGYYHVSNSELKLTPASKTELLGNEGLTLNVTIDGQEATEAQLAKVTWTSSDESIVKVDANGKLTYVATGTATITAKYVDSEGTCVITVNKPAAKVGNTYYGTLAEAVAAAKAGTVTLLEDASGAGIFVAEADAKDITIDLGGHTYTVSGPAVGSTGTENQGLHLEKGNKIIIKNGTVTSTEDSGVLMLVQNYADLTLEGVTLDGTNLKSSSPYTLSNNCGNVVIGNGTTINAKDGGYAFDVCATNYYPDGVKVTVKDGAVINGNIQYDVWGSKPAENKTALNIEGGTINGTFDIEDALKEDAAEKIIITGGSFKDDKGNNFNVPKDKILIKEGEETMYTLKDAVHVTFDADNAEDDSDVTTDKIEKGTQVKKPEDPTRIGFTFRGWFLNNEEFDFSKAVDADTALKAEWAENIAQIGEQGYPTLAEAIAAANAGDTIKLLSNVSENVVLADGAEVTFDLNGKTLTGWFDVYDADVTIKNGTVNGTIYANGSSEDKAYGHITIDKDATVGSGWGIIVNQADNAGHGYGQTIDINGTVNGIVWVMGNITDLGQNPSTININDGASITGDDVGIGLNGAAVVNVNGGTITGVSETGTGIEVRAGKLNVTGGTIVGEGTATTVNPNGSGTTTSGAGIAIAQHTTKVPVEVSISGGTIKGATAINESDPQGNKDSANVTATLTGGTFIATNGGASVNTEDKNVVIPEGSEAAFSDGTGNTKADLPEGVALVKGDDGMYHLASVVAQIDGTYFTSLQAAVDAAKDGDTVKLVAGEGKTVKGNGVMIKAADAKNITIDFNGATYDIDGSLVGSAGTESQAFHFEKGCTVKMTNGTITSSKASMLVQNYCDLTLENITLDGSNLAGSVPYTMSNNNGDVVIGEGTTINGRDGGYAFDVCVTNYYPDGVKVTVKDGAVINGDIQYDVWGSKPAENKTALNIEGGTINGTFDVDATLEKDAAEKIVITGGSFKDAAGNDFDVPDNKILAKDGEETMYTLKDAVHVTFDADNAEDDSDVTTEKIEKGTQVTKPKDPTRIGFTFRGWFLNNEEFDFSKAVDADTTLKAEWAENIAQIGEQGYPTLAEAIAAANAGDTITLLKEVTEDVILGGGKEITLDLNGKALTGCVDVYDADVTIKNGTVNGPVYANGSSEDKAYGHVTIAADATVNNGYGVIVYQSEVTNRGYGATVDIYGTVNGMVWVMGNIADLGQHPSTINVYEGAEITGNDVGIALNGAAVVNVNGGTITGVSETGTGIEVRAGKLNVTGGTIVGEGTTTTVNSNGSGTTTTGAGIAIAQHTTKVPVEVSISGGTIKGATAINESDPQGNKDAANVTATLTGGTFIATNGGASVNTEDKNVVIPADSKAAFSDNEGNTKAELPAGMELVKDEDGLYRLYTVYNVTFDGNGAYGEMEALKVIAEDNEIELPESGFTPAQCTKFDGWLVGDAEEAVPAGEKVTITGDTVIKATWKDTHDWGEWEVTKDATCTEDGFQYRVCKTNNWHKEVQTIPATGHKLTHVEAKAATYTAEGNIEYWTCEKCGKYFADEACTQEITQEQTVTVKLTAEDWELALPYTPGTLTGDGALFTPESLTFSPADPSIGRMIDGYWVGYKFIAPKAVNEETIANTTYSNDGGKTWKSFKNAKDGKEADGRYYMQAWVPLTEDSVRTSCEAGQDMHWTYKFAWDGNEENAQTFVITVDPSNIELVKDGEVVLKTKDDVVVFPHELNRVEAKAATCTEDGNIEYYTCATCDKLFRDAEGKTEITEADTVVKATGHQHLTKTDAKAATCTAKGNTEYWTCDDCGKIFSDAEGKTGITMADTVVEIDGTAHAWGEWQTMTAPSCTEKGIEYRVCADNALHMETREAAATGHTLTHVEAKAATCKAEGNIEYWTCSVCGKYFADEDCTQEIKLEDTVTEKTAHTWGEWTTTTAATCEADGVKTHTCSVCSETEEEAIPATGHDWGEEESISEAGCTTYGLSRRVCGNDESHVDYKVIEPTGHSLTHVSKKAATCTADGNTEYWTCSVCGKYFSDAEGKAEIKESSTVIKAAGHTWGEWIVTKEATTTAEGEETLTCSVCGAKETRAIPKKEETKYSDGWHWINGEWYYYKNNAPMKNGWAKDSVGWCYLGSDGRMVRNAWIKDSIGYCWLDGSGYWVTGTKWILCSGTWYYIQNGYRAANKWQRDSVGWCYLGSDGKMITNDWAKDSNGWCWLGADGYWVKDKWIKWKGDWYYLKADGYMATGTQTIGGKTYRFDSSGKWIQ